MPSFREPPFFLNFARELLGFWAESAKPPSGGLYHCLRDDGSVYDARTRHLVSSTRLVVQFAWAITHDVPPLPAPAPPWRALLDSCVRFLRDRHYVPSTGGYKWVVNVDDDAENAAAVVTSGGSSCAAVPAAPPAENGDDSNRSYGLCFALLAFSTAHAAGVDGMRALVDQVTETLTTRFWEAPHGLYADEASPDWSVTDRYRGQNANMHAVEAHMAAYAATRDALHLHRARTIAHAMCVRQAALVDAATGCGPLVYEHYASDWSAPDLEYNKDKPDDRFRPFGFQPGHLFEWAKLLVQLDALGVEDADGLPAAWRLPTARRFFDAALRGWDSARGGGFVYSMAPTPALPICNGLKYKWVQTEGAAAAVLLAHAAGVGDDARRFYLAWFDVIMQHFWTHFVDHTHGSIFRVLTADLKAVDDLKCPPGKVDYHATGLCYDAFAAFSRAVPVRAVNPTAMARPGGAYSHATVAGGLVFVSGQLPIAPDGTKLNTEPFDVQARAVLANVRNALEGAGSSVKRLAHVRVYITDVANWAAFNSIYEEWLDGSVEHAAQRPARAVVPVPTLHHGFLVEIEATAAAS